MLLIRIAVLVAAAYYPSEGHPDILYKYTDAYELIWTDKGSGGNRDGSIWRAKNFQSEFCSVGDIATDNYESPTVKAVMVSAKKPGAVVNPTSFSLVWNDRGSNANWDCAVYKMNAPTGYTCLGGVAMRSHRDQPDKNKYCCIKNDYIVRGDFVLAYNDIGTDSRGDVSLWTVVRSTDAYGIDGGNFLPVSGYSAPSTGYLLKGDGVKVRDVWSLQKVEVTPLNLNEVGNLKMIWNDAGSGARDDCSIWRAETREGYYPVGDIAVKSHRKPAISHIVRPSNPEDRDSLRPPVSYSRIWSDAGSNAHKDVTIWKANCPGGYVALGNVATNGEKPALGSIYCVTSEYALYGHNNGNSWRKVWADHGSGAHSDVTIYEAIAASNKQQTVRGFGAIASHRGYPGTPSLLNKDYLTYYAEPPIEKVYMYNVVYDLSSEKQQTNPIKIIPTVIENFSSQTQTVHRTISYSKSESSTFTFSQAIQIGVALECNAGIPLIGGSKTTISVESTSTFTTGSTTSTTTTDAVKAIITLPPQSKITAVITAKEYKADIPYTAMIKKQFFDGTYSEGSISGVYKGLAVSEASVVYGKVEKLGT